MLEQLVEHSQPPPAPRRLALSPNAGPSVSYSTPTTAARVPAPRTVDLRSQRCQYGRIDRGRGESSRDRE
jgi:hypothetical protein